MPTDPNEPIGNGAAMRNRHRTTLKALGAVFTLAIAAIGCTTDADAPSSVAFSETTAPPVEETTTTSTVATTTTTTTTKQPDADDVAVTTEQATSAVPEGLILSVTEVERIPGTKRSIDVELTRKPSEVELTQLGSHLRELDEEPYDRTFIGYYIEGGSRNMYWATTHFNPEFEVVVNGLLPEDEVRLSEIVVADGDSLVGVWYVEQEFFPGTYSLLSRADGTYTMSIIYRDGSTGEEPLVEVDSPDGRQFVDPDEADHDYLLVDGENRLNWGDDFGIWATTTPSIL